MTLSLRKTYFYIPIHSNSIAQNTIIKITFHSEITIQRRR